MNEWVLILGCSTGHGGATAKRLAKDGYGIIGFHLDRGEVKKEAELLKEEISKINNGNVFFWNINAASVDVMDEYIPKISEITNGQPLKLLLHSIAFGTTTNYGWIWPSKCSKSCNGGYNTTNRLGAWEIWYNS